MIAMLADAFVKATIVLLLAAAATLLLKRSSAALRHFVWALAFVGLLALPIASAVMPDWSLAAWPRLDVPVAFDAEQIPTGELAATVPAVVPSAATTTTFQAPVAVDVPVRWRLTPDWRAFIVPVWLGGAVLVLAALALGLARITWLGRRSRPVRDAAWTSLAAELARELGIRRPVRLVQSAGPAMPMTWGVVRPVILLPADADTWPVDRRRDVLLHELAHVQRGDFLTQLIARVACAAYWFHPLAWLAAGRLLVERERACDDHVLRAGVKPSAYASHLLEIARALRAAPATSLASVAMARPAQLATRLLDVLDAKRRREVVARHVAVPSWIAAAAVVLPLAALAPRVAQPAPRSVSIDTIPERRAPVMRPTPRAKPAPAVGSDTLKGCGRQAKHRGSSTRQENDDLTMIVDVGGCTIRLDATGKFTFNEDYTDIATVAAGARVVIEVDYGAHDYRLTIPSGGGAERVFKVDGDVRPFDAEAKAWLRETITYLLRRTGYQGEARARWILERRGIQALVTEIGEIQGDYARRIYYQAAIVSGKLSTADYERLVAMAGRQIESDYELAELLIAVAQARPLTAQMQAGFVAAANTLQSDYERHRVLRAALERPDLTPGVEAAMLQAAAGIQSDYELATLLIELNAARPIDDSVRVAFFGAANSLQSDYEHRRVLNAVVGEKGPQVSRIMVRDVLASAQTIASDYELAELLISVGNRYPLDVELGSAFFAAAASLGSDYERARSLSSLLDRPMTPAMTLALLESAQSIQSDHELSELLLRVIRKTPLDDTVRAAIRSAINGIGSQYDRGRVLDVLR